MAQPEWSAYLKHLQHEEARLGAYWLEMGCVFPDLPKEPRRRREWYRRKSLYLGAVLKFSAEYNRWLKRHDLAK